MQESLLEKDSSRAFEQILRKTNILCYQPNRFCHIDQVSLSRFRNHAENNNSAETQIKISLALVPCIERIPLLDIERLFKSAGRSIHAN